jgi:hypothetical protein
VRRWLSPFLLLLLLLTACAPGAATAVPTLTLIPATNTPTLTPEPPTATPANLPGPEDVLGPTPTYTITPPPSGGLAGDALMAQDPVAAELVGIAQRLVAADRDLPSNRIFLVDVRPVVWTDSALNCGAPRSEIVEQETDGYRIVLQAGDQEYLFHTDVDRVVPCEPANEKLPASVVLPTPEVTAEATEAS